MPVNRALLLPPNPGIVFDDRVNEIARRLNELKIALDAADVRGFILRNGGTSAMTVRGYQDMQLVAWARSAMAVQIVKTINASQSHTASLALLCDYASRDSKQIEDLFGFIARQDVSGLLDWYGGMVRLVCHGRKKNDKNT